MLYFTTTLTHNLCQDMTRSVFMLARDENHGHGVITRVGQCVTDYCKSNVMVCLCSFRLCVWPQIVTVNVSDGVSHHAAGRSFVSEY